MAARVEVEMVAAPEAVAMEEERVGEARVGERVEAEKEVAMVAAEVVGRKVPSRPRIASCGRCSRPSLTRR